MLINSIVSSDKRFSMYSLVISELVPGDNNVIEHLACTTCYDISDDPLCIYTSSSFKSSKRTPMNVCSVS